MRRTKPITLDICCAVLQRNDLFGLYISPMAPLFPPEFATTSSISGIQIARAMTVISPVVPPSSEVSSKHAHSLQPARWPCLPPSENEPLTPITLCEVFVILRVEIEGRHRLDIPFSQ
jgi:hypothetical protein